MTETPRAESQAGQSLWQEVVWYWQQWPAKPLWLCLFTAWLLLFHFFGNSTFGYVDTPSLFRWMEYCYRMMPDDQHGYLIPVVILILFWWKRRELLVLAADVWWPALLIVVVALLLHVIGYLVQQTRISIMAFFLGIYGLLGLIWGRRFMASCCFPLILCVFAVPLSAVDAIVTYPLRVMVAKIAATVGNVVLALPTEVHGSSIKMFSDSYDVAPACSGIRSLTALGAVTMIYAFLGFKANWKRVVILLSAFPLAVAGNTARVLCLLVLGEAFGQSSLFRVMNLWDMFGWKLSTSIEEMLGLITFIVALVCLFLIGRLLREQRGEDSARERQLS
jgi:exosortase